MQYLKPDTQLGQNRNTCPHCSYATLSEDPIQCNCKIYDINIFISMYKIISIQKEDI